MDILGCKCLERVDGGKIWAWGCVESTEKASVNLFYDMNTFFLLFPLLLSLISTCDQAYACGLTMFQGDLM
jgi:hypothetical protein